MRERNIMLVGAGAGLILGAAGAAADSPPPDPVAVAKSCLICHQGKRALDKGPRSEVIEGIERIVNGETAHPSIPCNVDIEALADALDQTAPTPP